MLTLIIAAKLFVSSPPLSGLQEILAIAGYLVGAVGFRGLLGVSRTAGGSTLEVLTFGVPFLVLAIGLVASAVRGRLVHSDLSAKGPPQP